MRPASAALERSGKRAPYLYLFRLYTPQDAFELRAFYDPVNVLMTGLHQKGKLLPLSHVKPSFIVLLPAGPVENKIAPQTVYLNRGNFRQGSNPAIGIKPFYKFLLCPFAIPIKPPAAEIFPLGIPGSEAVFIGDVSDILYVKSRRDGKGDSLSIEATILVQ